jgi:membrane glycosyltransferase
MADGSPPPGQSPPPLRDDSPPLPAPLPFAIPWLGVRRIVFALLVLGTAGMGTWMMLDIVDAGGITALEVGILVLFSATFGWIGIAFWHAILGFLLQVLGVHPLTLRREGTAPDGTQGEGAAEPLRNRTALVMPAFNEHPQRLVAGLGAMLRSLVATGEAGAFHLHLLSDTNDPALAAEEEESWRLLLTEVRPLLPTGTELHYRRRATNTGRKAGNIAEFCRRRGADYSYMVVLDADSLMRGRTLVGLARAMDANPRAGLIQTVPLPVPQGTLFGRLLRFAASLHSPMLATGQSFWQGDAANYWGHNAIVRVEPFLAHGTLPVLPGRPPLGGEVLSHDFVEAALLRRAGWQVLLLPEVDGSLEDVPGNIPDYARRDRRWAQGSLQHLRLLGMPGLHPVSRIHFLLGAMGYISSLLWLLMLLAGTLYVLLPNPGDPLVGEGRVPTPSLLGMAVGLPSLLVATGAILFLPKVLALILALGRRDRREAFGGSLRLLVGALLELGFSVVLAPVMMMIHSRAVLGILAGRAVRWDPQNRYGEPVGWGAATRQVGWITFAGLLWSGLTLALSPLFFIWLTPIFTGLLLAIPLTVWTSRRRRRTPGERPPLFEVDAGWKVSLVPVLEASSGELAGESGAMAASS